MSITDKIKHSIASAQGTRGTKRPQDKWAAGATGAVDTAKDQSFGRLKQADIAWVTEQLAVTQDAGIPLYRSLALLATMRQGTPLARRLLFMQEQMSEGLSLAAVFALHEKEWGPITVALVSAGEASGNIGGAFEAITNLVETRIRLRRKLRTAMMYPSIVLAVTGVLVAALLFLVVPRFKEIYDSIDAELPSVTTLVIKIADQAPIMAALAGIAGLAVFAVLRRAKTDRDLRRSVDRFKARIPIIGSLIDKGVQARVSSTMSILLSSGVPLLEVLRFASATSGSAVVEDALEQTRTEIADGSTFAAALGRTKAFPELMVQLVNVGEESGALADMMGKYAKRTTDEVEQATSALTSLVEPLMMVLVGAIVGVFLLALYLPIISLSSQLS